MGLSSNRIVPDRAGWARQQNTDAMPVATAMSGVDMRLEPYAYRELHWHSAGEWSYIMRGSVRIMTVNENGENFVDDLVAGDVWFFPAGVPHGIQALGDGSEFLLVFDQGDFSEDGTSLLTEMFLRNPKAVLAKNLRTDVSAFDSLPPDELYIFHGTPAPANISEQNITGPAGFQPKDQSFSYHFSQQEPYVVPGGSLKIIDPTTFPIAPNFSAALVTVQPGAMREIHWHLTSDEWNFFLKGSARITIFSAPSSSGTFDYQAGDVGYIPITQSHYVENVGDEDVVFLEVLQAPKFTDISVNQWLGLTPPQVVEDHLKLPASVIAALPKFKPYILPGSTDNTATNFTETPP
jgi:oxalate decarboxylase family bicupin protein